MLRGPQTPNWSEFDALLDGSPAEAEALAEQMFHKVGTGAPLPGEDLTRVASHDVLEQVFGPRFGIPSVTCGGSESQNPS